MSVETVLKNIMLSLGLDDTAPQASASDLQTRQIVALINTSGKDIAARTEWADMFSEWTIAGGVSAVDLPSDWGQMAESGAVRINVSGYSPVRVIAAPEQWSFLLARPSTQTYCHLAGGQLLFSPALPADGAKVRYVTKNWVSTGDTITQNSETLKIPESLIESATVWRWRRQKGLPFDDFVAEFEADLAQAIKNNRGLA